MNRDLQAINEEIDILMQEQPSMEKYHNLGVLFICKDYIEKMQNTSKSTVIDILDYKMDKIGARATILKLEPIIEKHIKDLELIAPTVSGEFIKKIREM